MKKRLIPITLVLSLLLCSFASAMPRYGSGAAVEPFLSFTGTTANCNVLVDGRKGDKISVTLTLKTSSGTQVKQWTGLSGTTSLDVTKTCSGLTKGTTYTLTATAVVNGETITKSVSATCR